MRVINKLKNLIKTEHEKEGHIEMLMPFIQPSGLWKESGRLESMGPELVSFKDRKGSRFILSPTHEEVITDIFRNFVSSYKNLPLSLFHISVKFRDEIRPRFGLLRAREFLMKDGYSFHLEEESLNETYQNYKRVYENILNQLGLKFKIVNADTGTMGGSESQEFHILSHLGESEILFCDEINYAASSEVASLPKNAHYTQNLMDGNNLENSSKDSSKDFTEDSSKNSPEKSVEEVLTPKMKTVQDVRNFLNEKAENILKCVAYLLDGEKPLLVFCRGDLEVCEPKLKKKVKGNLLLIDEKKAKDFGIQLGFTGPRGFSEKKFRIFYDHSVSQKNKSWIVGANKKNYHFKNFIEGRDFFVKDSFDLVFAKKGDPSGANPKYRYNSTKGIEIGHIFKLGGKYTQSMSVLIHDKDGKLKTPKMGCYGIGLSRLMAAVQEQLADHRGMVWPALISPFLVYLFAGNERNEEQVKATHRIYKDLSEKGLSLLYDDRALGFGQKIKDAELCGFPYIIVVGKSYQESQSVEYIERKTLKKELLSVEEVQQRLLKEISKMNEFN